MNREHTNDRVPRTLRTLAPRRVLDHTEACCIPELQAHGSGRVTELHQTPLSGAAT
jgi:hypothetical protein